MSWSDQRSKIVKNARQLEKFKLKTFGNDDSVNTDDLEDAKGGTGISNSQTSFVELGPSKPSSATFHPLENNLRDTESISTIMPDSGPPESETETKEDSPSAEVLEIHRKAQEEVERLKEETCNNCTLMEKEAWEKGFEKGEFEGIKAGEKKALPLVTAMNTLLSEIADLKSTLLTQYEREILDLIFSVSEKIIYCEISLDQRVIQETVLHTLQLASDKEHLMLRLHPDDIGVIETLQTSSADPSGKLTAVTLKADPSVSRGGCHLETPHGDIDASIETRLKRVYQTLVHRFEEKD